LKVIFMFNSANGVDVGTATGRSVSVYYSNLAHDLLRSGALSSACGWQMQGSAPGSMLGAGRWGDQVPRR
jgi:hypothetical protein